MTALLTTFFALCAGVASVVILHETARAIRLGRAICRELGDV